MRSSEVIALQVVCVCSSNISILRADRKRKPGGKKPNALKFVRLIQLEESAKCGSK